MQFDGQGNKISARCTPHCCHPHICFWCNKWWFIVSADDSDVTFRSFDGTLFRVHRKNIETHSEGFSTPPGTSPQQETVSLTEDEATLELLFQYIYPQRQPDLTKIPFELLSQLAEAAEKYQVFAAIEICNVRMRYANSYCTHIPQKWSNDLLISW